MLRGQLQSVSIFSSLGNLAAVTLKIPSIKYLTAKSKDLACFLFCPYGPLFLLSAKGQSEALLQCFL